jgi:YVTN family beta-propeller protein
MPIRKTFVLAAAITFVLGLGYAAARGPRLEPHGFLFIANQYEHTALLFDLSTKKVVSRIEVGVNGHEVAVDPVGHFGYVPIYGNAGVGRPGTDGDRIDIIDLKEGKLAGSIPMGKPVRPHCAKFGPDGFLYVSAELAQAIYVVDVNARKVIGEIPTGAIESHMFVISPDGTRAYTANVHAGSVSVLDLKKRALITVIPVAKIVQRISISPIGDRVFTHDQDSPIIYAIDTMSNKVASRLNVPASVYSSQLTVTGNTVVAVSPSGKLFVVNLEFNRLLASLDVPQALGEVALTADSSRAYISCPKAGVIEVLNLDTYKLEEPITLTPGVDGLEWFPAVK